MNTNPTEDVAQLGRVFAAVADPTRRAIVARLAEGTATVSEIARPFEMSLPAVSKHLKVLEAAGLLRREVVGRVHHCYADLEPLRAAENWLHERNAFWDRKLDALGEFLDGD
ncbi:MAG: metalloregulator ArsR/SmtB family transcription factor [Acidobacteria bacterium]|nr:metalloregulator ArsR/SmtB family transcription factor [Acidobacteriota bacterium]